VYPLQGLALVLGLLAVLALLAQALAVVGVGLWYQMGLL
jgi:hypothetical protein